MSIHDLARAASEDLRSRTVADVDAGLGALFAVHSRRRRRSRAALAAAAAAAVVAAWWGGAGLRTRDSTPEPTGPTNPACASPMVTCLGHRVFRFALTVPVTWRIPRGYGVNSGTGATTDLVESYAHGRASGVTVLEGVRAASRSSRAAPGVPATADGFVHWLAARPFLHASPVERTTLGGRDAWRVRVRLTARAGEGSGVCNGLTCQPITFQEGAITGIWSDMTADYTAVDLPGSGTLVVWSWAFGHDTRALAHNRQVVNAVSPAR